MRNTVPDPRLTVEQFLVWDDGTDRRYELDRGLVVAMAPASPVHGRIAQNVGSEIERHVAARRPCRAIQAPGIVVSREQGKVYVPDVVMTCEEPGAAAHVQEPRLVVEILSPSTRGVDQRRKVPDYAALPSVAEIWLVDSEGRCVLVWRKVEGRWSGGLPVIGSGSFASPVLGGEVALDRLYELTGL